MLIIPSESLQARMEGDGVPPPQSDTGLRPPGTDQNRLSTLIIVSYHSIGGLVELAAQCSALDFAPPLRTFERTFRASKYEGSVGLELGGLTGSNVESCKARRLGSNSLRGIDDDSTVVADARVVGDRCQNWKKFMADLVSAFRAPSENNPCNAVPAVRTAVRDLLFDQSMAHKAVSDYVDEIELASWSAKLGEGRGSSHRNVALLKGAGNQLLVSLRVQEGDTLTELSEDLIGRGSLVEAKNAAAINNISDIDAIYPGQEIYFLGSSVRPTIWTQVDDQVWHKIQTRVPEDVLIAKYSVEEKLTWEALSKGIWGDEYISGAPWLRAVNLDQRAFPTLSGDVGVPLEIAEWLELSGDSLAEWNGLDGATESSGIALSRQERDGLRSVFCGSDKGSCIIPTFRAIGFGSGMWNAGEEGEGGTE